MLGGAGSYCKLCTHGPEKGGVDRFIPWIEDSLGCEAERRYKPRFRGGILAFAVPAGLYTDRSCQDSQGNDQCEAWANKEEGICTQTYGAMELKAASLIL